MIPLSRRSFLKRSSALATLAVAAAPPGADAQPANPLEAGLAVRDITPEPGIPLWGYSDREGPATGTLDPLYAKALTLRAGDETTAVVVLDLGRTPPAASCDRIRARAQRAGVNHVILTATHTHHAPVMDRGEAPHLNAVEQAVAECIEAAAASMQPIRVGLGYTEADVAHNRRLLLEDGRCMMLWRNEEKRPTQPVDRQMGVIRLDTEAGKPWAVLVHFACHPVVMGPSNVQYSADYCGELARIVKEQTGAECLFLQGACGDINPYLDKTPIDKGAVEAMRSVGRECATAALAAFEGMETVVPKPPSVRFVEKSVTVGSRFDPADEQQMAVLREVYGEGIAPYLQYVRPDLAVPLQVLVLNDALGFAFFPGEIFVQYQLELKAASPLRNTFLCGYANEFHGYFPTIRDAAAGGYGGLMASYVGLGAGDKLVLEAALEIGRLTGKLKSFYSAEDFALLEADSTA